MNKNNLVSCSSYYFECNMVKQLLNMSLISFNEYKKIMKVISDSYKEIL